MWQGFFSVVNGFLLKTFFFYFAFSERKLFTKHFNFSIVSFEYKFQFFSLLIFVLQQNGRAAVEEVLGRTKNIFKKKQRKSEMVVCLHLKVEDLNNIFLIIRFYSREKLDSVLSDKVFFKKSRSKKI
jgi:hypothetical protein